MPSNISQHVIEALKSETDANILNVRWTAPNDTNGPIIKYVILIRSLAGELVVRDEAPGKVTQTNVQYPCDDEEVIRNSFILLL